MKFLPLLLLAFCMTFVTPALAQERGVWTTGEARVVAAVYCKSQVDADAIAQEYVLKGADAANAILAEKMRGADQVTAGFCNMRVVKFVVRRLVSTFADGEEVMNVIEVEDAGGDGPNGAIYYVVNWSRVVQAASGTPGSRGSRS